MAYPKRHVLKGDILNGLDLFSGYGGITVALSEYVRPVVYCEIERYAQGILLSRMASGELPKAPVWDDVTTLDGFKLPRIDIIYGGFPCQDISVAGHGKGLEGERSGLVSEIFRLLDETKAPFVFLENVPNIRTKGAETVSKELAARGYDCRWCCVSAGDVGAPHQRKRWFLLAHSKSKGAEFYKRGIRGLSYGCDPQNDIPHSKSKGLSRHRESERTQEGLAITGDSGELHSDTVSNGRREGEFKVLRSEECEAVRPNVNGVCLYSGMWEVEPDVGRVVNGCPKRVDRIKALGNGVVPLQVKTAFEILIGGYYGKSMC